jgi:hypothetical protein
MRMNAPERSEVPREIDHIKDHHGSLRVDTAPQELRPDKQTPPRNPPGPHVPDAGGVETFVGGAGI